MIAAQLMAGMLGATPLLYVSVERTGSQIVAHVSMRDTDDVELSLYELPAEPGELLAARGPHDSSGISPAASPPASPSARSVASLGKLRSGRATLLQSVAELEAGLSREGVRLFKTVAGSQEPLAVALPAVPRSEVEPAGILIRAWRLDVPEPGWNYADVDLDPLPAGLYSLVMRAGDVRVRATIAAGDLTALCVRTPSAMTVLAQERESGIPRAGAELYALRAGRVVLLGRTAADGVFTAHAPVPEAMVVRQGKELAYVAMPDVVHPGDSDMVGAVALDRRVAQPGDTVGVWALFRSVGGEGRLGLPDSSRAELQLVDREGRMLLRQPVTLSSLGTATVALEVPVGLAAGDYTVAVAAGDERRAADLALSEGGMPQLTLSCSAIQLAGEALARCQARDALGRPEPGVALRWHFEHPLDGPWEPSGSGAGITGAQGEVDLRPAAMPGGQRLRAEATDPVGRSASAELELPDAKPIRLAFRSDRRLLRPGRTASLTLEGAVGGEPFRGKLHVTATSVRSGPSGEALSSALFKRWLETDAHGRASISLTASSPGTIELGATTEPGGGAAHATLFVSEAGGDIPATPERLTLIPEVGERHRGEDARLLVLAPFEAGTVLLAFEPPVLPTQAVAVRGYSGVVHLTLPGLAGPLAAVATAFRGGSRIADRLQLLGPRALPLLVHAAVEHPAHPGGRAAVSLDTADEQGHALASQVTILAGPVASLPPLAELLARPQASIAIGGASSPTDSLPGAPASEPRATVPFGPALAAAERAPESGAIQTVFSGGSGRVTFVPAGPVSSTALTVLATAGPEEIGEARLQLLDAGAVLVTKPPALPFLRPGDEPDDKRGGRTPVWALGDRPLSQTIAQLLATVPLTGPSADVACAAVRAQGALSGARSASRDALARLAQLENLEGGFGDSSGELRRDLAALRGLRALGAFAEPALVTRARAEIGELADEMEADDPERVAALAAIALASGPEPAEPPARRLTSDDLRSASAEEMALWLSAQRPSRSQQQLAGARVRQLLATADVLDLGELAVAAARLSLSSSTTGGGPSVARQVVRLQPAPWTQALLEADEEPADPRRVPLAGAAALGDELEVQLTAPIAGRGTYCLRDFPPAGAVPEGTSAPQETVLVCGEPSGGVLRLAYRMRLIATGRFRMPPPAFGAERPAEGGGEGPGEASQTIEVSP